MRALLLFACLLPSVALAAPAAKTKARTLKQLVDLAMTKGQDYVLKKVVGKDLGFNSDLPTKRIGFVGSDSYNRLFFVVLDSSDKPSELIWNATKTTKYDSHKVFDVWMYRTTLDGKIVAAAHGEGPRNQVRQSPFPITQTIKSIFTREKKLFLAGSYARD